MKANLFIYLVFFCFSTSIAQDSSFVQVLKGRVVDADTKQGLPGAKVKILNTEPFLGAMTDPDGYFRINEVPIGRYDIEVTFIGYSPSVLSQIGVNTGKEVSLSIEMQESLGELNEFKIVAKKDKTEAGNEMAMVSARSFSVEETSRYAGSFDDPSRMAQSFAGVSNAGDDLGSEIVIRGNSSKGLLWQLEGVEIPSPNHFGDMGSGGGSVSMLSSSTLANSDFYTGAFPAEFGNATSGVFDLKLRNGNSDKREHTLKIGVLGVEATTEGYFSKDSRASYLFNYRYSSLGLLNNFIRLENVISYQDASFKINVPTKKLGTFALFGLAGQNDVLEEGFADSTLREYSWQDENYVQDNRLGIIGLSHKIPVSDKAYVSSTVAASGYKYTDLTELLSMQSGKEIRFPIDKTLFGDNNLTATVKYNHKFNPKSKLRIGGVVNIKSYNFDYVTMDEEDSTWYTLFDLKGQTQVYRTFGQWKYRWNEKWTTNMGAHYTYLVLNGTQAVDPRASVQWQFKSTQSIAFSAGMHSKPEHISTYNINTPMPDGSASNPNKNLEMLKSIHYVGAYDINLNENLRLKVEAYYQHLYDLPVSNDINTVYSTLNASGIFGILYNTGPLGSYLVSEGTGRNYGIDVTFERFFNKGYYYLVTGSLYDSKFKALNGREYNTRYANNYILNVLGGKEWKVGKSKKNVLAMNGKVKFLGGRRVTPYDLEASRAAGEGVRVPNSYYSKRMGNYFRIDYSLSYKINKAGKTHTFMIDLQNITNRYNPNFEFYNQEDESLFTVTQNGLIPIVSYKLEF